MSDPITILHVFGRMNRGGAEIRTLELLRHVDRRRFRFHFCTLAGVRGELDDELRALGSPVHSIRHGSFGFPRRFGTLLREHRFDVVYSHVLNYSGLILRLAARHGVPIRVALLRSLHDGRGDNLGRTAYRRLMRRWIDRYATNIVAVGEGVMVGAWGPDWTSDPRCEVIYNGLDVEHNDVEVDAQAVRGEFDLPSTGPLYVHVGHMRKPKNHGRLIEIFAAVRQRQADASLLLVGHGEKSVEQRLRQQAARLGLSCSVVFCGGRTDVPRLLAAADAMIFPSLWEGLPGAVLEAAAVGTPVLATDLPGVRDIATRLPLVRHLSLDESDTHWATTLENLAATSDTTREAARRDFRGSVFTIDQCAQRHSRIWEGIASGERRVCACTHAKRTRSKTRACKQTPYELSGASQVGARVSRHVRMNGLHDTSTKPLTILHVHGRMGRGGAEMRTVEMFRNIDRQKYRFHFCAMSGLTGELDDEIRSLGGQVHRMPQEPLGFSRRLRHLIRQHKYGVVHSHLHFYSGYPLKLAAECNVPVRVAHFRTTRDDIVSTPSRRAARILLSRLVHRYATGRMTRRWIDRYATDILGVSRWVLESTWGSQWADDPRCRVVYDALAPNSFDGEPDRRGVCHEFGLAESSPLLVHVGRMAQPKNHVRLVSIFAEVLRREPAARLLLIGRTDAYRGDHAIERRVRVRMAELGIADQVVFAGERTDVPRLLKAADLLIFPSLWEGLGDVVLEARAAGTPVLACDLPCVLEIADRLPGVRCLSLEDSDATWAEWALRLGNRRPSDPERRTALEFFRHSQFTVGRCLDTLCRLWDGPALGDASGGVADG